MSLKLTRIPMVWMAKLSYVNQAMKCASKIDIYMIPDSAILIAMRRNCLAVADISDLIDARYMHLTRSAESPFNLTIWHTGEGGNLLVQYIFKTVVDPQNGISAIPGPMFMSTDAHIYGPRFGLCLWTIWRYSCTPIHAAQPTQRKHGKAMTQRFLACTA